MKRNNFLSRRFVLASLSLCFLIIIAANANVITFAANAPSFGESAASSGSRTGAVGAASPSSGNLQFNLEVATSTIVTKDRELCISSLSKAVDKVTFTLAGPKEASFDGTAQGSAGSIKYCFNLYVKDFPDGSYKMSVNAQRPEGTAAKTVDLQIKKGGVLDQIVESAKSLLEDRCAEMGMSNLDECKDKVIREYAENVGCAEMNTEECEAKIKEKYADALIAAQERYKRIKEKADQYFGKDATVSDLEKALNEGLANPDISVPLQEKSLQVKALKIAESILVDKDKGVVQSAPIAVAVDADGDGIPDDIEKRLGTDLDKADTDGDGYADSEEVLAGYDPLGPGKKTTELSPIEKAILENSTLQQPKGSGQEKGSFTVDKIENAAANESPDEKGYVISGKAEPDSVATLYIYSDIPIVATVATDAYGNWEYRLKEPLSDGDHEIYVTINDNTGKVVDKSKPFGFPVQEAKAVTPAGLTAISQNASENPNNTASYYAFAALLTIFGIAIFLFAILRQKNKLNQQ